MKLIIIEGLDNTGKTTVIKEISDYYEEKYKRVKIIHCTKPGPEVKPEDLANHMNSEYMTLATNIITDDYANKYDVVIIDRCWYSECVYGPMYRNRDPEDAKQFVLKVEQLLINALGIENISLILLNVSDPKFSVAHEDGLSLSDANVEKIKIERQLFQDVFNISQLENKANIIVNNGLDFKPKADIFNTILNVVNKNKFIFRR